MCPYYVYTLFYPHKKTILRLYFCTLFQVLRKLHELAQFDSEILIWPTVWWTSLTYYTFIYNNSPNLKTKAIWLITTWSFHRPSWSILYFVLWKLLCISIQAVTVAWNLSLLPIELTYPIRDPHVLKYHHLACILPFHCAIKIL